MRIFINLKQSHENDTCIETRRGEKDNNKKVC